MTSTLENFVVSHPAVTLSDTDYGRQFHLGTGISISSSPSQRLQTFVENGGGAPYHFMVIGRLSSFKVIEDSVCELSVVSVLAG
jgi:hypothetical protein